MSAHAPVPTLRKQVPMNPMNQTAQVPTPAAHQNRSREMQLMPEALARARISDRLSEAESERKARGLARARKLQMRAERASLRARRALAVAVMQ